MRTLFGLIPLATPTPARQQRDTVVLDLPDGSKIDVLRVRDPRARRIKLSVGERGVRLTLPLRASLVSGDRFLQAHGDWLRDQLARIGGDAAPLQRGLTQSLPLRGEQVPLHWSQGRFTRLVREPDRLDFQLPANAGQAAMLRALRDFYEAEARADVAAWMPKYLAGLPRPPARLRLKIMSSQWGSLAPDGTMVLDLALVLGRPEAFEYVLVHELCHLIHANHSRAFWREVEARCPDWRHSRDYFREHGRGLKAALHALLPG